MLKATKLTISGMLVVLLLALVFGAGMGVSQAISSPVLAQPVTSPPAARPTAPAGVPPELQPLLEAWDILARDHVDRDRLNWDDLGAGALQGLLQALGDPHTSYIDPVSYQLESGSMGGAYEGIGAVVDQREGQVIIVSPIKGGPAEAAGLRAGDQIMAVDGDPIQGMSLGEVIMRIRGPAGTSVSLTLQHEGEAQPVDITLVRARIKLPSVSYEMKEGNIGLLRITAFTLETPQELTTALQELKRQGAQGLVLDLRGNPGGYLDVTVQATSQFLKQGVVLYEESASGERTPWPVRSGGLATDLPLAVLIDGGSASGSEVMAGAIQDFSRAPLIGTRSFGKGAVNIFRELSNGGALYLTTARWLTPNGRQIEGAGLTPDQEIALTQEDMALGRDPQLQAALDYVKTQL